MERLSRVISIMIDLINHDIVDTTYLANKYEVSTRTIYRDMDLLNLSGIPIVSKQGKQGGFSVLDGFRIDRNILSENDFSIILRGLQTLMNNHDRDAGLVYEKLLSILSRSKKEKIIQTSNHVVIDVSPFEEMKQLKETYQAVDLAIKENKCIKITYTSSEQKKSVRVVEPYMLIFKSSNWYLYAYCKEKENFRYFKLYRIREFQILEESFEKREIEPTFHPDFWRNMKEVQIVLKTNKDYAEFIKENYSVFNMEIKDNDAYVTIKYPMNEWIYSMLLGMGKNVEIISPNSIKEEVICRIQSMNELYKKES